jgi:hypothetical protein
MKNVYIFQYLCKTEADLRGKTGKFMASNIPYNLKSNFFTLIKKLTVVRKAKQITEMHLKIPWFSFRLGIITHRPP